VELEGEESIASKAARARLKGVEIGASGEGGLGGDGLTTAASVTSRPEMFGGSSSIGVGVGLGVISLFFLPGGFPPPPKKLLKFVCFPENSSRNFVANRGGSGASRGTSLGYIGAVESGRSGGLSISFRSIVDPSSVVISSYKSI
jgi:hypothetical protein